MKLNCIVDSGAYSAWRSGNSIDLDAYCDFIKDNEDWIGHYVVLDEINPRDPEAAASASFENLKRMRKRGLNPMAVYHAAEGIDWLYRTLDAGCDYIGLAGLSLDTRKSADDWYDLVWQHLVNAKGEPVVKVHALGEGRPNLLCRFPWQSADSTSGIYSSQLTGKLDLGNGINLGMRNDFQSMPGAREIGALSGQERAAVNQLLRAKGIDPKFLDVARGVKSEQRSALVMRTYLAVLKHLEIEDKVRTACVTRFSAQGLFKAPPQKAPGAKLSVFDFYMVVMSYAGLNFASVPSMAQLGGQSILTSFFYMMSPTPKIQREVELLRRIVLDPTDALNNPPANWLDTVDIIKEHRL